MRALLPTGMNAFSLLAPQLTALVLLDARAFGEFSLVYLVFALSSSVMLSVVTEASARSSARASVNDVQRAETVDAATRLAIIAGVVGAGVSALVLRDAAGSALAAVACLAAAFRGATRFIEVADGQRGLALRGDTTTTAILLAGALALALTDRATLHLVLATWAAGVVGGIAVSTWPRIVADHSLSAWYRRHRANILPLLRESLIMDVSSVGAPFLIAPLLGTAQFGVYRAVSNVGAPTRLVTNPMRPFIVATPLLRLTTRRTTLVATVLSCAAGGGAWMALTLIGHYDLSIGVLSDLADFAVAAGVFVGASTIGHLAYLVARAHTGPRNLWRGRLLQSGSALAVPVAAAAMGGLPAAVWAYSATTAAGALVWLVIVGSDLRAGRDRREES